MWKKKKQSWGMAFILLIVFLLAGYYLGGLYLYPDVTLENYSEVLILILRHPFSNYWNV